MNETLLVYIVFNNDLLGEHSYECYTSMMKRYCNGSCETCKMKLKSLRCYQVKIRNCLTW